MMDRNTHIFLVAVAISILSFNTVASLECYSCSNEDHNWKTCTKNVVVCQRFQDACVSYTAFHRFIDYQPRTEKWHNISKGCDVMESCEKRAAAVNDALCDRSSRHEWACVECCIGDLCNYFVTLGSPRTFSATFQAIVAFACLFVVSSVTNFTGH